jgi:transposase
MESTGKYWVPVYNLLEDAIHVTIANPKWVSAVKGNKDDVKDSKWIGDLYRMGLVPGSFIPERRIRILRECMRYRSKLIGCRASEKNRYQNVFTVCNIALDSVVSSMSGKSASDITKYILASDTFDPDVCVSFLKGSLRNKAAEVIESIEGYQMDPAQKSRAFMIRQHMNFLDREIGDLDALIDVIVEPYEPHIALLRTIPGVDRLTAIVIISEIGTDMSQFTSSKRLCAWAGLSPSSNESAGKKKSVKIPRAGVYIKPALVQASLAAVRSKDSDYYRVKHDRIARRRGKKRAHIAVARMILAAAYHMLLTGETFNPCDLKKIDMPTEKRDALQRKAIREAKRFLLSHGIVDLSEASA